MILVDAGPLIAGLDRIDRHHEQCSQLLQDLPGPLLVPGTIIAEVCYMLAREDIPPSVEALFLQSFAHGYLECPEFIPADFARMAELVERYGDFPLGGSDASVIALAERLDVHTVLTLDRRHFEVVRPAHVNTLELLP